MKTAVTYFRKKIVGLTRAEKGAAAIEFSLSVGVLIIVFLGSIEVSRYVLIMQKLQNTVNTISNVITSIDPAKVTMTTTEMGSIVNGSANTMMKPYQFGGAAGSLIVTDIVAPVTSGKGQPSTNPTIRWRYCNTNSMGTTSKLGAVGSTAALSTLPNGFTMNQGDEIVAAEIYYNYKPIISDAVTAKMITARQVYNVAISIPHTGTLATLIGSNCN